MLEEKIQFSAGMLTFDQWLDRVDIETNRLTGGVGFTHEDFRDWNFADAYEDGIEPVDAAVSMLAEDVMGQGFLDALGMEADFD
jgi:hypothetical protein